MNTFERVVRRGGAWVRAMARIVGRAATHRVSRVIAMFVVGAAGGMIALALSPPVEGPVGPGRVELHARSAVEGRTELAVPPLGTISAHTHASPVLLSGTVTSIDLNELQGLMIAERPTQKLIAQAEDDLADLARRLGMVSLGAGLLGGAVAGLIASSIRWRRVLVSTTGGVVSVAVLLGSAWSGFDASAMSSPSFHGPIERAPNVVETVSRHVDNIDNIRSRINTLGREIAELYALSFSPTPDDSSGPETTILHVSDIHSNPLAMEVVVEIADSFGVDAVLDTGDLTSFGLDVEARITDQISSLAIPYLFVPGNHDSDANRAAIADTANVQVLTDDVATVNGVRILGVEDPTFTATNETSTAESNETNLERAPDVAERVTAVGADVLAVHNERLASESLGLVPLVVHGHAHQRAEDNVDGTIRLGVGSTGANGLESFTVDTGAPFEAQLLRFSGRCLRYRDYLRVSGIGGDVQVERQSFRLRPVIEDGVRRCVPY